MIKFDFLKTIFIVCLSNAFNFSLSAQCNRMADSLELVKLYNSLDGPNWTDKTNWLVPGKSIDTWYGITLYANGCVSEINLSRNKLSGQLYDFDFSELIKLDLSINSITGIVPNFSKLPNLEYLNLNSNKLLGTIPNFSNLPKLESLTLAGNELDGVVPNFDKLPNLKLVSFTKNHLTGNISNFDKLPNLQHLIVQGNELTGTIPNFDKLSNLQSLYLTANKFEGTIPNFDNLPNLKVLWLSYNELTGTIPNFDKLPNLTYINLTSNQLIGTIPNFDKLPNLINLILGSNQLTGTIPNFDNLPNLLSISIDDNQLTGTIPNFNKLPDLEDLSLSGNQLTGTIPNFDKLPELYRLNLSNNKFFGNVPNFDKIPNLLNLSLWNNQLTGTIPNFDKLPNLVSLYLDGNQLTSTIPNFDSCRNLNYLDVYENYFTFENIKNITRVIRSFIYYPQHKFYKDTNFTLQKNQELSINLQIDSSLSDNTYKWTNNINTSWNMDPSQDIHSNTYTFKNIQTKDAGRYTVKVTNPTLPLLTLESNTISIKVCNVQQDSSELVNLFNNTSGSNWKIKANWLQAGKPISTWYGISTTAEGCVRSINLDNNNLIGSIPALDLNTLDTLILSNNQLSGNIPEFKIPFIKYINMRNNALIGAFPAVLLDWMNLGGLDLGDNNLKGPIPPDLGDICELQQLKLDNNKIEGELPEEITKLQKLQIGRVNFSNNIIDTLKEKIIFFCPFGDNILENNPSYNRFLGICNRRCIGTEWNMLKDFPWIADTIGALRCKSDSNCVYTRSEAGFVNVRGIKVVYTQSICCPDDQCNDKSVETRFYDCGGKRLETAQCGKSGFCTSFGAISMEEFDRLVYDKKWQCGDTLSITTDIKNIRPKKYIFNSTSQQANCYPNPVNEILTCEIEGKLKQLTVSNLQGKVCKIKSIKQNGDLLEIDFSGLPSGIYFMEMWTESGRLYRKVIKGE
jgi:Leucine-rich repeat (LRR) protein